jgi:Methylase involved in ubiquinone/menaquinone biosynthesis
MTDFNLRARDWDSDPLKVERARKVADAIRKNVRLTPDMTALEYGCGTGLLSFALQSSLGSITLADSSAGMLEVLREKIAASGIHNMNPLRLDLATDPLLDQRFDIIYSMMTLHHIVDTRKVLADFYTLLDQPGKLFIADLDREDGSFHGAGFDGHNGFDQAELTADLEQAGFGQVRFSTVYEMVKEVGGKPRSYPLFLMVAEKG